MYKNSQSQVFLRQKIFLIIFGLFLSFIVLEIVLRIGGFVLLSLQEHKNRLSLKQKGAYRIMCLGESTTMGQYPLLLEEILNQRSKGIKFSVIDKGVSSIDSSIILSRLESNLDKYHSDIVITMMGINDQGLYVSYDSGPSSKIKLFFRSFRIYKLVRLLWLHRASKLEKRAYFYVDKKEKVKTLKKALELNPHNEGAYAGLGWNYRKQGKFSQAEDAFIRAIELNPNNDDAYVGLGGTYLRQGKHSQAEEVFKKAIKLSPKNDGTYIESAENYKYWGKFIQSEESYKKALELNPRNDTAYIGLGYTYMEQRKFSQAEEVFKKALELNSKNDRAYGALSLINELLGNTELAKVYEIKTKEIRYYYYKPKFSNNYHELKEILDRRGIKLVCVQYPLRSIEPLKKIFEGQTGVIFVDNEKVFRDAVKSHGYGAYFKDMFAGDFGHCTDKGNRLLAENIANAILTEVFNK